MAENRENFREISNMLSELIAKVKAENAETLVYLLGEAKTETEWLLSDERAKTSHLLGTEPL